MACLPFSRFADNFNFQCKPENIGNIRFYLKKKLHPFSTIRLEFLFWNWFDLSLVWFTNGSICLSVYVCVCFYLLFTFAYRIIDHNGRMESVIFRLPKFRHEWINCGWCVLWLARNDAADDKAAKIWNDRNKSKWGAYSTVNLNFQSGIFLSLSRPAKRQFLLKWKSFVILNLHFSSKTQMAWCCLWFWFGLVLAWFWLRHSWKTIPLTRFRCLPV